KNINGARKIERQKRANRLQTRLRAVQRGLPKIRIAVIPVQAYRTRLKRLPGEAVIIVTDEKSFALKSVSVCQRKLITPSHICERAQNILPRVEKIFRCPVRPYLNRLHMRKPLRLVEDYNGYILDLDRSLDRGDERDPLPKLNRSIHIFKRDSRLCLDRPRVK